MEMLMLLIKNTHVVDLHRAMMASGNAMTIGEINTADGNLLDSIYERDFNSINQNYESKFSIDVPNRCIMLGADSHPHQSHDSWLKGILVSFDVKYPLYWSPEFQRYHFNEIISSQSTMHKLTSAGKREDFDKLFNKYVDKEAIDIVEKHIKEYTEICEKNKIGECSNDEVYTAFMKVRSNLPSGYEMWMTVDSNYLELKTMYTQRKGHKLKEDWDEEFCSWCEMLPLFKILTDKASEDSTL